MTQIGLGLSKDSSLFLAVGVKQGTGSFEDFSVEGEVNSGRGSFHYLLDSTFPCKLIEI